MEQQGDKGKDNFTSHNMWTHNNRFYQGAKRIGAEDDQIEGDGTLDGSCPKSVKQP
jgi:pectate lyase